MEFVFNEWLLDWHRLDATTEEKRKVRRILEWLVASEHSIVILLPSPFIQKLNNYRRAFNTGFGGSALKELASGIAIGGGKYRRIESPSELPDDIQDKLSVGNFTSDRYLFESAETTEEKIIVTTDTKLVAHFEGNGRYQLWNVEELIEKFKIE